MKQNIFQKIGNTIEKTKKQKKEFIDKYWKLPATERLHYDSKVNEIEKDTKMNFLLTSIVFKTIIFVFALIITMMFLDGFELILLKDVLKIILGLSFKAILITIILDCTLNIADVFIYGNRITKLNKRFKLK